MPLRFGLLWRRVMEGDPRHPMSAVRYMAARSGIADWHGHCMCVRIWLSASTDPPMSQ
ncbi:hypothetical protein [Lysobacter gummosus]|uniref:hypothetical protein n=1 Tax=Lysobacter gummosus TaxID=262324 RepID=UPI00364073B2